MVEKTMDVLLDVSEERGRQDDRWGEQNHPFRSDAEDYGMPSSEEARLICDAAADEGLLTWGHILVEELAEVLDASVNDDIRKELIQLAAVCVAAVEALDRKAQGS